MPQEFQVLRCYACSTYQVHFVKKSSNKWQCKMCNEKQSLKQVFGRGTGQDCRLHVQKLNAQRLTNEVALAPPQPVEQIQTEEQDQTFNPFLQPFQPVAAESKWISFLQKEKTDDSSDDEDPFQKALRAGDVQRIRKARAPKVAKQTAKGPDDANCGGKCSNKRASPNPNVFSATAKRSKVEEFKGIGENAVAKKPASKWGQFLAEEEEKVEDGINNKWEVRPILSCASVNDISKKSLPNANQNSAPKMNKKSKWEQFLPIHDPDDNFEENSPHTNSYESEKMEMQCSDIVANKDLVPRATLQSVKPRESYKTSTAPVKRQGGIDFVLDENIGDDELDALLTL
ncbi:Hypothetical predicted protein [Cloeon dipterum]|uniref:MRN complex-interacting protein N-terminal domain-containing protein n=1 Tax=Cloeon dipterum TaxID=197152 RepID=A0A8S1BTM6_9INSE|nr:Hypothetical predicted protein [Cloeon dipterum]